MRRRKLQVCFRKQDDLRFVGHLDLARAWERLFRRAEVRMCMSAGFHPRPRMRFPSALPVGAAGLAEIVEVEIEGEEPLVELQTRIARLAPAGLVVVAIEELADDTRSPEVIEVAYDFPLPPADAALVARRVELLLGSSSLWVERGNRRLDLRSSLLSAVVEADVLRMRLQVTREASLRARDVLAALELTELERQGSYLTRTHVLLAD